MLYRFLADMLVVIHFAYVAFVVVGLVAILLGGWRGWPWVRHFWFRLAHLVAILIVAVQAVLNVTCPLTLWERQLRLAGGGQPHPETFVGRMVHSVLFFEIPQTAFTVIYCLFAAAVLATLLVVRPRLPGRQKH
jgi:hypothetical protein